MARKALPTPIEPEWPQESACRKCGAPVYSVETFNGNPVELDAQELEITSVVRAFVGPNTDDYYLFRRQLVFGMRADYAVRSRYRFQVVQSVGGYRLMGPELFQDAATGKATWLWFSQRVDLDTALAGQLPIHSEHFATCAEMTLRKVLAKLSATSFEGSAAGNQAGKATSGRIRRNINLRALEQHWSEAAPAPEAFARSSPLPEAKEPARSEVDHEGERSLS